MKKVFMMSVLTSFFLSAFFYFSMAQLTALPSGGNYKASVSERIGLTDVTIDYSRPGVKGREGKIWGTLIPVGYIDQGFGSSKQAPWRAGANENTTISFSNNVKIEGHDLPAGKYGFFIAYDPNESTIIFSKNNSAWGSFYYDPKQDVLQVKVKPVALDKSVERLKYEFIDQAENSAVVALEWEKLMIPFKIEVDYIKDQLESFRAELTSNKGFYWEAWDQAAQWCVQHNTNLDEALLWSDTAITFSNKNVFQPYSTKAMILDKLGHTAEGDEVLKKALPFASMAEVHQYGRQLLAAKKPKEAFDVFKMNYDKHPNEFTTNMGMARAYSGIGNYKKALEFAQKAQAQVPDPVNKANLEKVVKMLQEGKDIN
ncbi:MAG: DUF2911 domain-containing protein [Bacteroidetes bacterium]|nr:DUF2911 domain-containing protein [Bacteroidota bacterium]